MRRSLVLRFLCLFAALLLFLPAAQGASDAPECMYAYSGTGTVKLYNAETGAVSATLADGTLVFVLREMEGMRYVQCAQGAGWAAQEHLTLTLPAEDALGQTQAASPADAAAQSAPFDTGSLLTLGVAFSTVRKEGKAVTVNTCDLPLPSDIPAGKELADIYAPRQGKAMLRESGSVKGKGIGPLTAGILVAVLEYGKSYCRVTTGRLTGWVMTSSLRFHTPFAPDAPAARAALLSYNGYTNGSTTIGLRLNPEQGSIRPIEFATGTPVTVLSATEEWAEIDVKGRYGFVPAKYITYID